MTSSSHFFEEMLFKVPQTNPWRRQVQSRDAELENSGSAQFELLYYLYCVSTGCGENEQRSENVKGNVGKDKASSKMTELNSARFSVGARDFVQFWESLGFEFC